jgi:hypothetical protein
MLTYFCSNRIYRLISGHETKPLTIIPLQKYDYSADCLHFE